MLRFFRMLLIMLDILLNVEPLTIYPYLSGFLVLV